MPILAVVLGGFALYAGLRARRLPAPEAGPLAAALTLAALAATSLAAARLEIYSPWLAGGTTAAALAVAGIALRRPGGSRHPGEPDLEGGGPAQGRAAGLPEAAGDSADAPGGFRGEVSLLLLLLTAFGLLYGLFPTYFLLGWQDPGLYLVFAVQIARTGGLVLDQPSLAELHAAFGDAVTLGYPGIYSGYGAGLSDDPTRLIPQFAHLFPALLANAWSPFGLEGLVRGNAVIAAVGLGVFFAFTRRLLGPAAAFLATFLLGINPALIWHARLSVTEPLLLVLTFTGLQLLDLGARRRSLLLGLAAGAVLGLGVFDRLDAAIAAVAVGGAAAAATLGRQGRAGLLFAAAAAAGYFSVTALGLLDAYVSARPYFLAAWTAGATKGLLALNGFVLFLVVAALALSRLRDTRSLLERSRRHATLVLAAALLAWVLYGFLFRWVTDETFTGRALLEMAWYVTPLALLVAAAGMTWAISSEPWDRWLGWILLAAFALFLFSWRLLIDPYHPWAGRRWVAQTFPAVAFFTAYVFRRLWGMASGWDVRARESPLPARPPRRSRARRGGSRARRARGGRRLAWARAGVAAGLALFLALYAANAFAFARPYLFTSMLSALPEGYRRLVAQLDPATTHLTWSVHSASILTYIYERPTIHVARYERGMEDFSIVGAPPGKLWGPALLLRQEGAAPLCGRYLEEVEGQRPVTMVANCYDASPFSIGVLGAGSDGSPPPGPRVFLRAGSLLFRTEAGERDGSGTLAATGRAGWLVRGPGVELPAGRYRVSWSGATEAGATVGPAARFEVRADGGEKALVEAELIPAASGPFEIDLDFLLQEGATGVEFPVWVESGRWLQLDAFGLQPADAPDS
jgi:hypothetical protein